MNILKDILIENPIIAAIRNDKDLTEVIKRENKIVFILYGSIVNIGQIAERLRAAGKIIFIHLDMIEGLRNDEAGIHFIKNETNPYGVITTRQNQIRIAKHLGLVTILRLFIIDSKSLATGSRYVEEVKPEAIEVMPGVSTKIITKSIKSMKVSVIAGGLIETKDEVIRSLNAGALAISTTKKEIWDM